MGSGAYYEDVHTARAAVGTTRTSDAAFNYSASADSGRVNTVHPDLNIRNKTRECCDSAEHPATTPIVVAMDVTSSRGKDAKTIYEQVPSFLGSLAVVNVVSDPQILWAAIGDATQDRAPIQIGQFESDRRIDDQLGKIWMEEGGGGTGEESYELAAYYLARKTKLDVAKRGAKGFLFFTGDEAPYATVSKRYVESYIGDKLRADLDSREVFREVQEKFHTFLIFPRSTMQTRRAAIDTEIQQRLERLGGRFREVDIRASLIWDTRDDLDLHCMTPAGEHIYYGSKRASCRGELDVDRNVRGEDPKPVENIRWAKETAPRGKYRFWVELYNHHERPARDITFKVEIDNNGQIETFERTAKAHDLRTPIEIAEFSYDPRGRKASEGPDNFAEYQDDVILGKWGRLIPPSHIIRVQDPASVVEVMLGTMALQNGKMDLDGFVANMKERKVTKDRRTDIEEALGAFYRQGVFTPVSAELFN